MSGMFDFNEMAKNLQSNINLGKKEYKDDDRFWKITKDENKKGAAIIRLLPDKNLVTMVKIYHYFLKTPNPVGGKPLYFIANSPDTIEEACPVKEYYMRLIDEKTEEAKEEAKKFSRNTKFIANILVVKDPGNPENNGKVFLWEFGTKLLGKFNAWVTPSEQELEMDVKPMNVWNPIEGYNITLKIRPDQHSFTYDDTTIVPTLSSAHSSIVDEESALKFLSTHTYELNEFLKPENFESYDSLKNKFDKYLVSIGKSANKVAPKVTKKVEKEEDDLNANWPIEEEKAVVKASTPAKKTAAVTPVEDDDSWLDDLE